MELAFVPFLEERAERELPGWEAQLRMAPSLARRKEPDVQDADSVRKSAVMLLLVPGLPEERLQVLLTVRSQNLNNHGGQISLPGGRIEEGESVWQAATRETCEEVGVAPEHIRKLGALSSLYIPVSNNIVYPVVGFLPKEPELHLQEAEVEEAFFMPLYYLLQAERVKRRREVRQGFSLEYPYWDVHPSVALWGATAMILSELRVLYEEYISAGL